MTSTSFIDPYDHHTITQYTLLFSILFLTIAGAVQKVASLMGTRSSPSTKSGVSGGGKLQRGHRGLKVMQSRDHTSAIRSFADIAPRLASSEATQELAQASIEGDRA